MNKPVRIAMPEQTDYRARFTAAEFVQMSALSDALDIRLELVHGELERLNPPMDEHSKWQGEVYFQLRRLLEEDGDLQARVEIGIDLGEETVLGCDIALVERDDARGQRMLRPDEVVLVIEVAVTSLVRDTVLKCREYARVGIANYWVIDPAHSSVKVFTDPAHGEYNTLISIPFGEERPVPGADRTIVLT